MTDVDDAELVALRDADADLAARTNGHRPALADRLRTEDQLRQMPPPAWLIDKLLPLVGLAAIVGKWGSYKTFLALSWALAVATGTPWLDRAVKHGGALYLAAEGAHGFPARIDAWRQGFNVSEPADIHFLPEAVNLRDDPSFAALVTIVEDLNPRIVVVDTLARAMAGGDENSPRDMGLMVERLSRLARDRLVLVVHHPSRAGTAGRGHSMFDAALDVSIVATRDAGNYVELSCSPSRGGKEPKDAPPWDPISLVMEDFGGSLTVQPTVHRRFEATATEAVWTALDSPIGRSGLSRKQLEELTEFRRSSVANALNALVSQGKAEKVGSDARPRYRPAGDSLDLEPSKAVQ